MKNIYILIFLSIISIVCNSQINTIKKDSSEFISAGLLSSGTLFLSKPLYLNLLNSVNFSCQNKFNTDFAFKNTGNIYNLLQDSMFLMDYNYNSYLNTNKRTVFIYKDHLYYFDDLLSPYGNNWTALIGGSVNYFLLLFDKR